jgi:hypothetical protein
LRNLIIAVLAVLALAAMVSDFYVWQQRRRVIDQPQARNRA